MTNLINLKQQEIVETTRVGSSTSSLDEYDRQQRMEALKTAAFFAVTATLAKGLSMSLASSDDHVHSFFRIDTLTNSMPSDLRAEITGKKSLSIVVTNILQNIEELSPFKVLRSVQASNLITPMAMSGVDINIPGKTVSAFESTYEAVLSKRGAEKGLTVTSKNRAYGFRIQDKKMYEVNADNSLGKKVLNNASFMWTHTMAGTDPEASGAIFKNKLAGQYHTLISGSKYDTLWKGESLVSTGLGVIPIGGNNPKMDLFRAYGRAFLESAGAAIDDPFAEVIDMIPAIKGTKIEKILKSLPKPNLWTGGEYRQSSAKSFKGGAKSALKILVGVSALAHVDQLMFHASEEGSASKRGLYASVATAVVDVDIAASENIWDNFQNYKDSQEKYAPGSTSLYTMAGIPLALGSAAGVAVYMKRMGQGLIHGAKSDQAMTHLSWKKATKWGVIAGLIIEAPFIPGALIGDSSEDKKDMYYGRKEVAIKKNRWWGSGSNEFQGDQIKFFDTHSYAKMMKGVDTAANYGDKETEFSMSFLLHPFDYMKDPYRFEKMHEKDRPYPIWGMDVSEGMFFGKLYEKTLGRIIKPDVVNKKVYDLAPVSSESESVVGKDSIVMDGNKNIRINKAVTEDEASLIREGLLVPEGSSVSTPGEEALGWVDHSFKDFGGLKGYLAQVGQTAIGLESEIGLNQLARSGEVHNLARTIKDMELNGLFGITEGLRRYIPIGSGTLPDRHNPLTNDMPSWMPGEDDSYFKDFTKGDVYATTQHGTSRLPGAGYEAVNRDVAGFHTEDYPDIHKFKILADVALGSSSYYDMKAIMSTRASEGLMTEHEEGMYERIISQTEERGASKRFNEYSTEEEMKGASSLQRAANHYWEAVSHKTEKILAPSESLTFWRPAGKLVHKRTATEDYQKTRLGGSDMALWDTPIESFIKPALNDLSRTADEDFVTRDIEKERELNEYFDKLEYVKQRRAYRSFLGEGDSTRALVAKNKASKTRMGVSASKLTDDREILKAYLSLEKADRPYFGSFTEAEGKTREKIVAISSDAAGSIYKKVWKRKDLVNKVAAEGGSVEEGKEAALRQAKEEGRRQMESNPEEFKKFLRQKAGNDSSTFSQHMAEKIATEYISDNGGMPSDEFSGWDPRIDIDKVKLRAIQLGGRDIFKHGFWKSDTDELRRYVGINRDEEIQKINKALNSEAVRRVHRKEHIKNKLSKEGYIVDSVDLLENESSLEINLSHE